jgi:hypothetical protein
MAPGTVHVGTSGWHYRHWYGPFYPRIPDALSLVPSRSRKRRFVASLLGAAGSLALRFDVHPLGYASVRDPRASFEQQRGAAD